MSNGYQLELLSIADKGGAFLNFWDWLHGDDACFLLIEDKAYRATYQEDGQETLEEINLVEALQKLCEKLDERQANEQS